MQRPFPHSEQHKHKERVQRVSVRGLRNVKNLCNARPHTLTRIRRRRVLLPASISTTRSELFRIGGGRATSCSKLSGRATLPFRRPGSETQHQRGNFGAALQVLQGIGIEYQKKLAPVPFRLSKVVIHNRFDTCAVPSRFTRFASDFSRHCLAQVAGPLLCFGGSREIFPR